MVRYYTNASQKEKIVNNTKATCISTAKSVATTLANCSFKPTTRRACTLSQYQSNNFCKLCCRQREEYPTTRDSNSAEPRAEEIAKRKKEEKNGNGNDETEKKGYSCSYVVTSPKPISGGITIP